MRGTNVTDRTYSGGFPLAEYLRDRIDKTDDGCWLWTGAFITPPKGRHDRYGLAIHRSLPKRKTMAHRAVYEHLVGPIPEGFQLDHLCRVRECVNPAHLEPVTQQENIRRGEVATKAECVNGHREISAAAPLV